MVINDELRQQSIAIAKDAAEIREECKGRSFPYPTPMPDVYVLEVTLQNMQNDVLARVKILYDSSNQTVFKTLVQKEL